MGELLLLWELVGGGAARIPFGLLCETWLLPRAWEICKLVGAGPSESCKELGRKRCTSMPAQSLLGRLLQCTNVITPI